MKISRKANTIGALMIAAGAVVTGASITSGAMAADDAGSTDTVNAVVVGSASADGTGDAYQCVFDDLELPAPQLTELPAGAPSGEAATAIAVDGGTVDGGTVEGDTVQGGAGQTPEGPVASFEVSIGDDGTVSVDGEPVDGEAIQIGEAVPVGADAVGAVSVDASGSVVMSTGELPDGAVDPVDVSQMTELSEVREGTADECASLLEDMQATPTQAPVAAAGAQTKP